MDKKKKKKKKKKKTWLKFKPYLHFGKKLNFKKAPAFVISYVSDKEKIKNHNFYPLIHRVLKQRRYKKLEDCLGNDYRSHYDFVKKEKTAKPRHIFYPSHLDGMIFAYYANTVLGKPYQDMLDLNPELSKCISAYRKIPINPEDKNSKNKSNIHFAKDIFEHIKSLDECTSIALDISGFFDNLDHQYIKQCWSDLIGEKHSFLPEDHFRLYQALTQFSYVNEQDILYTLGLAHIKDKKKLRKVFEQKNSYFPSNTEFRKKILGGGYLKPHSEYEKIICKGKKKKGIPQGTPISAFLANLYLLDFDRFMYKLVSQYEGGLYRRYSDDIIIVCPPNVQDALKNAAITEIRNKYHLEINDGKTEIAHFKRNETTKELECLDAPLRYLGFEFNGKGILLKSSALAKYYRRMKVMVKRSTYKTYQRYQFDKTQIEKKKEDDRGLWWQKINRKYTNQGRRNFISYAMRAAKVMNSEEINQQIRNHHRILTKTVNKHQYKHRLRMIRFYSDLNKK